jgi:hypothetical protein
MQRTQHTAQPPNPRLRFWATFLWLCGWAFCGVGLSFALLPSFTAQVFALILYGNAQTLLSAEPWIVRYLFLIHAILGAVLASWGFAISRFALQMRGDSSAQLNPARSLLGMLLVWFIPDTMYSLLSGFWQNAVFNLGFAVPRSLGLWGYSRAANASTKTPPA